MELLLSCCRSNLENNYIELKEYLSGPSIDWQEFIALVARHRIFPMVHQVFKNCRVEVPVEVQLEIENQAAKGLKRVMNLAGELEALHQLFDVNKIEFISLKGPLMIWQLYGDYACRQTRDLDILVEEINIDKAILVLSHAGYHLIDKYFGLHPEKRALYLKRENHVRLRHPHKMIFVELHWTVSKYFTTIKTATLFDHQTQVNVHGRNFNTLPPDDYFIVLATHGIYHRFELLLWLYDIGHMIRMPAINMKELPARAEKFNCTTAVNVSLALAESLFNLSEPGDFQQLKPLTKKEQFIYNQCVDTIMGTSTQKPASRINRFLNTVTQRVSQQVYLLLMTDDRASKQRVLLNTLIKPYVWEDSAKIPQNNLLYLVLTQVKWLKIILSGRMNQRGQVRKK
ncbi:MAG: nucleotidyltransferase domain-containing protein [Bacteroidales bacterium]